MSDDHFYDTTELTDPTIAPMALDLLNRVLRDSSDLARLAKTICVELRELTGARAVLLSGRMASGDGESWTLTHCEPTRRRDWSDDPWTRAFIVTAAEDHPDETIVYSDDERLGVTPPSHLGLSLAMPLQTQGGRQACILALGIPVKHRLWGLRKTLDPILKALTLVMDNAFLIEDQDALLARRTAELLERERQLQQSQKLESIGQLAGGVAHDFNNLLMGIMNYVELCRDGIAADHPIRKWLDEVTHDAERSAAVVRQLLAFARKQTIAPKVLDLNDAVTGTLKMLQRLIGEDINLLWQPGVGVPPVKMDPVQLDQILANLCVNARDAIKGVGKITIETAKAHINAEYCAEHAEAIPGEFVVLVVSDDGSGMDAETLANIFEPFFTTKGIGEGTGLGLATIYGIVKQNGGFVNVYSEPGQGSTFRIYLPRCEDEATEAEALQDNAPRIGGNETILLVEDEKSVRVTTRMFLQDLGYTVLAAEDPEAALRLAKEHDAEVNLVITDVVMPGMNGRELAAKLTEAYPHMRCLFMSGYTANVIAHRGILDEDVHFLSKPFSRDELARKVREVLGGQ